ncbi:M20/M25/M40 family metallo-hydrolase [Coraliomargarita sp. SDUM461004]|uniref:M20/M25/M40 family metallo-hydrolase n=1 Tax=Thalassobacterium sedimentorum TaxID=3041258 RepID=A0ABU1AG43_9BACT|nr:M20/M25/M40 family metallo-hydrolase [Coraliomargarita sp. SDUM461004]MDQ8193755.1 M20/M25/M40 family metallo-hydrolase [Coraliomargarita sp. SDUM461004]
MHNPVEVLKDYIRFASVSTDPAYAEGMAGAREYASRLLTELGFTVEVVETELHPILLADRIGSPDWPHVVIYGHYDVQPADPFALWTDEPFEPTERDGRLYGRGAADNKGPTIVHMAALSRVLKANPDLPLNITYVIEGEEEIGSPSMPKFFDQYAERLSQADFMLVSDTGSPNTEQIVITTALRGLVDFEIKVRGPKGDLHSGIHGGAVYNPLQALMEICASLHNTDGSVNVPGFYDDVVPVFDWEREELKRYPETVESYRKMLDVPAFYPANGLGPLEAVRFGPTLEFNGIGGGYQGEGSKTVIPSEAFAKITCRLVANQDPVKLQAQLIATIQERCPEGVRVSFRDGGIAEAYYVVPPERPNTPAQQSPALARAFKAADAAIANQFGKPPIYLREGGSIPVIADFKKRAGLDALMIGLFTPVDNLHAPDESFSLWLMDNAIRAFEQIIKDIAVQ